jgi:tRNA dimethylallyltransferase
MLAAGALEEVAALAALGLDPALPAMRAHGVPELLAHLRGEMPVAAARARAVLNTGQYTKRQATWFRHHALADPSLTHIIHARTGDQTQFQESGAPEIFAFLHRGR